MDVVLFNNGGLIMAAWMAGLHFDAPASL